MCVSRAKELPANWDSEISVIVPARNEEATIASLLEELQHTFPSAEIIVVDNASSDRTAELAVSIPGVVVVEERAAGKGNAMRHGAFIASRPVLLFHDADTEYSVVDAYDVAAALVMARKAGSEVMTIGVRAWRLSWLPVISFAVNWMVRTIFWLRFRVAPEDVLTGTRCLARDTFLLMNTQSASFAIETEMTRRAIEMGLAVEPHPVRYTPRTHKEGKKIGWRHLLPILSEAVFGCESRTVAGEMPNVVAIKSGEGI